jgi:hypothetical protein
VRLTEFKRKHGIITHEAKHLPHGFDRWGALKPFPEDAGKNVGEIMSESAGLYDDSGHWATAPGELSAVKTLCEQLGIPFDL